MKRLRLERPSRFVLLIVAACVAVLSIVAASVLATTSTGAFRSPDAGSASCRAGFKPAVIGGNFKCLHAGRSCAARYQNAYRKYGFTCVSGHLRKTSVVRATPPATSPPPLPPAPPPPLSAQPGHYEGSTSQLTTFAFDVTASGGGVTNLITGQVNQGCTPHFSLYGGVIDLGTYEISIATDGSFALSYSSGGTVGSSPVTGHTSITGHMSGATAIGTLEETTNFTYEGVAYACGSGRQTWTVTRT
jgi:hypothetical protein